MYITSGAAVKSKTIRLRYFHLTGGRIRTLYKAFNINISF